MRTMRSTLAVLLSICLIALAPGLDGSRAAAAVVHSNAKAVRVAVTGAYARHGLDAAGMALHGSFGLTGSPTLLSNGGVAVSLPGSAVKTEAFGAQDAGVLSAAERLASPLAGLMRGLSAPLPEHGRMSAGSARSALDRDFLRRIGARGLSPDEDGQGLTPESGDGRAGEGYHLSPAPSRKPFVSATVIIDALRKLAAADPEKGLAAAVELFKDETERRPEVKMAALRVVGAMPAAKALPVFVDLLAYLTPPAQTAAAAASVHAQAAGSWISRQAGIFKSPLPSPAVTNAPDLFWALRRELVRRLGADAEKAGELKELIVASLKKAFAEDRNVSVRIMAAWALGRYGIESGPEVDPARQRAGDSSIFRKKSVEDSIRDSKYPEPARPFRMGRVLAVMAGVMIFFSVLFTAVRGDRPDEPKQPAKTEQVDSLKQKQAADSLKAAAAADSIRMENLTPEQSLREMRKDVNRIANVIDKREKKTQAKEKEQEAASSYGWVWSVLSIMMIPAIFVGLFFLMRKLGGGGPPGMGKAPKGSGDQSQRVKARFTDVAGIDDTLIELEEVVDFIKNPARYKHMGAKMPKGAVLLGPPGTGKTLIAKAVAGEAGVNFISISGSEFVQMYVGVGAARVRELFAKARASAPAIIFIDEIDAVGGKRGSSGPDTGGRQETESTLNQLLVELDGFDESSGIFVIGATNMMEKLDPALVRPGRLGRHILVDLPDARGREAILQLYAGQGVRLGHDADLEFIASRSAGLSGAAMMDIINDSAMLAVRRGSDVVELKDLDEAFDRATIGETKRKPMSPHLKRRVALHEAGHILANLTSKLPNLPNKVTILPKSNKSLGHAEMGRGEDDGMLYTRTQLEVMVDVAMGGLITEEKYFQEWSTGPDGDLKQATRIARYMVEKLGMSKEVGFGQSGADDANPYAGSPVSEATKAKVDEEIKRILNESYARVKANLEANWDRLEALSQALLEKETLTKDAIVEAVGTLKKPAPKS